LPPCLVGRLGWSGGKGRKGEKSDRRKRGGTGTLYQPIESGYNLMANMAMSGEYAREDGGRKREGKRERKSVLEKKGKSTRVRLRGRCTSPVTGSASGRKEKKGVPGKGGKKESRPVTVFYPLRPSCRGGKRKKSFVLEKKGRKKGAGSRGSHPPFLFLASFASVPPNTRGGEKKNSPGKPALSSFQLAALHVTS